MKATKNILLTFDYELYLGRRTGTAKQCVLEPTEMLRKILNKQKAKGIFFVDILCLEFFDKHGDLKGDLNAIINQLIQLYNEGHYVFPHIHAHWLDSKYLKEEKQFDLSDLNKYSLSSLDELEIDNLFIKCIAFLENIGINYPSWGYRAGGWCMQPFSLYESIFTQQNIQYDFSVLPGYKNENPAQAFDYTAVKAHTPFQFSSAIEIPDVKGRFTEFPISIVTLSSLTKLKDRLIKKYLWRTGDKGWGDGQSAQTAALKSTHSTEMISIDVLTYAKLNAYSDYLKHNSYMHWISHPKMFTRHGLNCFASFLRKSDLNYRVEYDFMAMLPEKN